MAPVFVVQASVGEVRACKAAGLVTTNYLPTTMGHKGKKYKLIIIIKCLRIRSTNCVPTNATCILMIIKYTQPTRIRSGYAHCKYDFF